MIYPSYLLFLVAIAIPYFLTWWVVSQFDQMSRRQHAFFHFLFFASSIWFIGAYAVQNL